MNELICPDIFDGQVKAFFTKKPLGADIRKIADILSIRRENVYLPTQKHTDRVQVLNSAMDQEIADAVVTDRNGVLIGVKVADCVPVLLFDRKNLVVGAVHAGWRGTAEKITQKTIALMVREYGSSPLDISMALGPSIRGECYQVDREVKDAICKATGDGDYYMQKDNKCYLDLPSANMLQAISMGVPEENIWVSNECTYCLPENFYSYRYTKEYNGSQGGFIGIFSE